MRKFIWECIRSVAHTLFDPAQAFAQLADRHCEECVKPMVPLDGVDMCVKCGDLKVAQKSPETAAWASYWWMGGKHFQDVSVPETKTQTKDAK